MLRLFWLWARKRGASTGRGTVYLARDAAETILRVSGRTIRRALAKLESLGWIRRALTLDHLGLEVPGFEVALAHDAGFAVRNSPGSVDGPPEIVQSVTGPATLERSEANPREQVVAMTETDTRQHSLFDLDEVAPVTQVPEDPDEERDRKAAERRETAERLAQYERDRYAAHPLCKRAKRADPKSIARTVQAIEKVLEAGITEVDCRAAIELQWARCQANPESWRFWTGTRFWEGAKLTVLLGWLEEDSNAEYWAIAKGDRPPPGAQVVEAPEDMPTDLREWHELTPGFFPMLEALFFSASERLGRAATDADETEQLLIEAQNAGCAVELRHATACMRALAKRQA